MDAVKKYRNWISNEFASQIRTSKWGFKSSDRYPKYHGQHKWCKVAILKLSWDQLRYFTSAETVMTRCLRPLGKPKRGSNVGSEFCLGVTSGPSRIARTHRFPIFWSLKQLTQKLQNFLNGTLPAHHLPLSGFLLTFSLLFYFLKIWSVSSDNPNKVP